MGADIFGTHRPDECSLTELFGIRPPHLFTRFVELIHDRCSGNADEAEMMYWRLTGLRSSGANRLENSTPRELFAVGDTGGDGEHAGFLVHAPEAPSEDYPWVLFAPAGCDASLLANDTPTFFTQLLSYRLVAQPDFRDAILGIAEAMGIKPDPELGATLGYLGWKPYWESEPKVKPEIVPTIPEGWWFERSSDGIGVLAPVQAFAPEGPIDLSAFAPSESMRIAEEALDEGFPATALLAARSLCSGYDDGGPEVKCIKRAYRALGRELLAKRMEESW